MMLPFLLLLQWLAPPGHECIAAPCSISVNYPYDAVGEIDTRPGTWGTAGFDDGKITFSPPHGYRVHVLRVYGNVTARMHAEEGKRLQEGRYAGALFALQRTSTGAVPWADLSATGCMLYLQADVGMVPAHVEFDTDVSVAGLLDEDAVLIVRRAVYLNETGQKLHLEPSFVLSFRFEKE